MIYNILNVFVYNNNIFMGNSESSKKSSRESSRKSSRKSSELGIEDKQQIDCNSDCVLLLDELMRNEDELKTFINDNVKCYNGIIHIKYNPARRYTTQNIPGEYDLIIWEELKTMFRENKINKHTMIMIGAVRRKIIDMLVKKDHVFGDEKIEFNQNCYVEAGSNNPTSDLDFSLIHLKYPSKVPALMIRFYNDFYKMFGNFPDITFDTNYYICSTFIGEDCFKDTLDYIKPYFRKIVPHVRVEKRDEYFEDKIPDNKNYFRLNNYTKPTFVSIDRNICLLIQKELLKSHNVSKKDKMIRLLKSSKLFYGVLQGLQFEEKRIKSYRDQDTMKIFRKDYSDEGFNKDSIILLLRCLYYVMCATSNESYVSDNTLYIIVFRGKEYNVYDKCLAFVDNYIFIHEWFEQYKGDTENDLINFFDVVSKYITRCIDCLIPDMKRDKIDNIVEYINEKKDRNIMINIVLSGLTFNIEFDNKLYESAVYWRTMIRGKKVLTGIRDKDVVANSIIQYLQEKKLNVHAIYTMFKNIYDVIKDNFGISHESKQIKLYIDNMISEEEAKIVERDYNSCSKILELVI
jgi:hypothetical protein